MAIPSLRSAALNVARVQRVSEEIFQEGVNPNPPGWVHGGYKKDGDWDGVVEVVKPGKRVGKEPKLPKSVCATTPQGHYDWGTRKWVGSKHPLPRCDF